MRNRYSRFVVLAAAFALLMAACGGGDSSPDTTVAATTTSTAGATTTTPAASSTTAGPAATTTTQATESSGDASSGVVIELTARDLLYDQTELFTTAGVETAVVFGHKDYEPHNFHIRAEEGQALIESEDGDLVADLFTPIREANITETLTFTIAEPGEYYYFCDTHPLDMHGYLVVGS